MWTIKIVPGSPAPIYQQITTQVRHAIVQGAAREGELLPSVRALAEQLLINPNTVAKAYADLSRDGLVEAMPGRGLAVAARRNGMGLTRAERLRRLDPVITQLLHDAIAMDMTNEDVQQLIEKKWKALEAGYEKQEASSK